MELATRPAVDILARNLDGALVLPDTPDYEESRRVWNGMIDRHPAAIVQCASERDVRHALSFALESGLMVSIRGAGHNIAGNAIAEGGLVIDFSRMKAVRVDASAQRAHVQAGATLGELDEAVQKLGFATPVGVNSTTGIAGLTLGGGFGWLTRKYGMTVDNLVSARVITAEGKQILASAMQNPELFWALRGGGGNFGIVTEFELALHAVGPDVLAGLIVFPHEEAAQVLRRYREFVEAAPEDLSVWVVLRQAPPLPFLPERVHGKDALILALCHVGDPAAGESAIAPLGQFGRAWGEHIVRQPYVQWQKAFDPLLTAGARNYWKSHNLAELGDGVLGAVVEHAPRSPSPQCEVFIAHIGGVANRIPPGAMAYGHRDARFVMNIHGRWDDAAEDASGKAWARGLFEACRPFASGGAYVNFMTEDETDRIAAAYGANYSRLVEIKRKYDPHNVFRMNQNIRP